jgi:REP element-mobilizing transposase RayT
MNARVPAAYLVTFGTYGTWVHGDARGSQHHSGARHGMARVSPGEAWERAERRQMHQAPMLLDRAARAVVEQVASEVCAHRGWVLLAANARSNHVHVVVASTSTPEDVLRTIKAWATRRLVESGSVPGGRKVWGRHGSTLYLWTRDSVERAVWYVLYEQDDRAEWR